MRYAMHAASVAAVCLILACGGSDKAAGPGSPGTYTAQVSATGQGTRSLTGSAIFVVVPSGVHQGFALALGSTVDTPTDAIFLHRSLPSAPGVGTHPIVSENVEGDIPAERIGALVFLDNHAANPIFCDPTGGTLTITTSTGSRLAGSFTMELWCERLEGDEDWTATLSGTFDAPRSIAPVS